MLDLAVIFSNLGIVNGDITAHNQYTFFKNIEWSDGSFTNNQYEFYKKIGGRYNFFKQYGSEYEFYKNISDPRIYNYTTFYKYAGEYLETGPQIPIVDFSVDLAVPVIGETITFTDLSTNSPTSWLWDFGDGTTSTLQNPTHIYNSDLKFDVKLVATNSDGFGELTKTDFINVGIAPVADFSADNLSPEPNDIITFTNTSVGTDLSYEWDFGDGTTSTLENPTHTYTVEGSFDISLKVTNLWGEDTELKVGYINVLGIVPVADFSADNLSPEPNDIITFTNTSTDGDTYLWNFGDGNTSTLENPTHTYTVDGTFDVSLTVTNLYGSDTELKVGYINVLGIVPVADFVADNLSPTSSDLVTFTNISTDGISYLWDFGDGTTSTLENPTHTYTIDGTYDVSLTVTNLYGSDTELKVGYIEVSDVISPTFTMKIDLSKSGGTTNGFKIPFTTNQTSFPLEIDWGDGNTDIITSYNQTETEHIYSTSGIYDISIKGMIDNQSFQFTDPSDYTSSPYKDKLIEIGGTLDITDGTHMVYGCLNLSQCNIISLDNLTIGVNMFYGCNLTSWTIDLPNLNNGSGMFNGNGLTSWTIELPNLTNAFWMFSGNSLTSWDTELPKLTDGTSMFRGNSLTSWNVDLPDLTNGFFMFFGNGLTSWSADLPNLTNGQAMFNGNSLTSWNVGLPNLTNGANMFNGTSLTSWDIELPNLTNGQSMFYGNSLTSWTVGLPNLMNGQDMFYNNSLASWTADLPNLTNGHNMFRGNTINTTDYSNLLISLEANNPNNYVTFHGGNSKYNSSAVTARSNLNITRSWTITDGGLE